MKKILAAMLIISMTAGMTLQNVKASDEEIYYSESQIESIAQNYTENESLFEKCLCSDEGIAYWKMMHKINADHAFTWALDISSKMIEEYPDKKRYAEILSCLISMQTGNIVEQVSEQSRFDHLKDTEDITWNAMEIANELVGKTGVIGSVNDIVGSVFDGASTIIESKEIAKYYETVYQDYAESTMFLDAIVSYSENSELKEVAGELKKASDSLLAKRLECLADINEEVAKYEAKFFYENLGVELLKQSDVYNTDDAVKFFADEAIKITENFSNAKLAFNVMIYAGNLAAGTNNTYNRYQEMKVVADISDALVKASEAVEVPNDTTADQVNALNEKCYYYKSLIVNHARGEYLVHQLLMKDAEGVSSFRWLQEYFSGNGMKTDEWYDSQIEVLVKCYDTINNIFHVDAIHDDIEISDYLKSYDQLKELLAECDAVITSGGVSVGQKDYLPAVLEALDADLLFAGVAQKPGSPMLAGTVGGKLVFCLSGNPFAAAATLEQYAIPALLRAAGRCEEGCILPRTTCTLTTGFSKPSKVARYLRAKAMGGSVTIPGEGSAEAHSSGSLSAMMGCNCLVELPAGSGPVAPGEEVEVLFFVQ